MCCQNLLRLLNCCVLAYIIAGCSSQHKPAPVYDVAGSIPANQYPKGSLKQEHHIVKSGETLYSIAWRADVDVRTLAKINQIAHPYRIFPGQKILLAEKLKKTSNHKTYKEKLNNYSVKKTLKKLQKPLEPSKKQEYGEVVDEQKTNKNQANSDHVFSQKIRKWQWPASGKVVQFFSTRLEGNKGIDIAGRKGDKVLAAADGKVVYVGNGLRGYGRLVIIKHNDDYLSAYAHNDQILVKEQQTVKAGQYIAKMGDSDADRVMLHFEVRFRGKSVNPLKYLPKK